jgi:hypothetical protein
MRAWNSVSVGAPTGTSMSAPRAAVCPVLHARGRTSK